MFLCPQCKRTMTMPQCACGYVVPEQNGIWQLSDAPDMITMGEGDKYIGYEHIGESYSGQRKFLIEERDALFAKVISDKAKDGIFLDLACGDGCFTVPTAANGTRIIAGDISNRMLSILKKKAAHNGISLEQTVLCRMNALEIPLADESVDVVVANSVLHLISNPQRVISEIWRVLKQGGIFLCGEDAPGKNPGAILDNSLYNEIVNSLYGEYWKRLSALGILPKRYRWKFDREATCTALFSRREETMVERGMPYETPLKDGFLPRFLGRGFSDQADVPPALHEEVTKALLSDFEKQYGADFAEISFHGVEDDLQIIAYYK
ncbi:MAG: class I SAM-dependent methyltransferase [Clostridia bacterium]|nr:class I SAM-dependent methyltransferase [Clostridia bacterium]